MITTETFLAALTVAVCTSSYVFYYRGVFRQGVKPHLFSWLIWGITMCIGAAAGIHDNGGTGSWITLGCGLATLSIACLAVKHGEKNVTRADWAALVIALSSVPLWLLTDEPLTAVVIVTLIDAIGYAPTMRKAWRKPFEENIPAFLIGAVQFGLILFTLKNYTLTTTLYTVVIMAMNVLVVAELIWRRRVLTKTPLR